jgi:anaerobic nitric oxide reductase transcription regulator
LRAYSWPGNVRELENVLSRVVLKAAAGVPRGEVIVLQRTHFGTEVDVVPDVVPVDAEVQSAIAPPRPLREATLDFQRAMIRRALRAHNGNWSAAARALGMHARLILMDEPTSSLSEDGAGTLFELIRDLKQR